MNSSAEQLLGLSRQQCAGREISGLLPGLEPLRDLVERAVAGGQRYGKDLKFSVPHHERMNIQVACHVSPFLATNNKYRVLVEMFDATLLRRLEREQALISQRTVSRQIIRRLAHEIRNPLGGLRGAAQLLQRELIDPEQREYTEVIIAEADRLVTLTDGLLGPTNRPEIVSVNVHEILEHVFLLTEGEAPSGIRFYRDYDPSLPPVRADRDQLIQALLNIARNAVQSVAGDGNIIVRTRVLTNFVIGATPNRLVASLEIEDNGPGIPADIEDSIFFPLVTGRDEGTGLGLPLAQDLVSRNGGLIEFESSPGRTVFMVRLPLVSEAT